MASTVHMALAVLLIRDGVSRAPPFLAIGPPASSRLWIGVQSRPTHGIAGSYSRVGEDRGFENSVPDGDEQIWGDRNFGVKVLVDQSLVLELKPLRRSEWSANSRIGDGVRGGEANHHLLSVEEERGGVSSRRGGSAEEPGSEVH